MERTEEAKRAATEMLKVMEAWELKDLYADVFSLYDRFREIGWHHEQEEMARLLNRIRDEADRLGISL